MSSKNHAEYQRNYRKNRIHRIIIFSIEEYQTLENSARECKKPFSTYVRELALSQASNQYVLPDMEDTKRIQLLLIKFGTNLNQIAHTANAIYDVPPSVITQVQEQFKNMEREIMAVYKNPPLVEDMVRDSILKNPEYLDRIKTVLNEFS